MRIGSSGSHHFNWSDREIFTRMYNVAAKVARQI